MHKSGGKTEIWLSVIFFGSTGLLLCNEMRWPVARLNMKYIFQCIGIPITKDTDNANRIHPQTYPPPPCPMVWGVTALTDLRFEIESWYLVNNV